MWGHDFDLTSAEMQASEIQRHWISEGENLEERGLLGFLLLPTPTFTKIPVK